MCLAKGRKEYKKCLTKVKLTVEFFTVDNIKSVWYISNHVTDFKIKPLVMMVSVNVWVQYQVILKFSNLNHGNKKLFITMSCVLNQQILISFFFSSTQGIMCSTSHF
jgi:hypothetical protein